MTFEPGRRKGRGAAANPANRFETLHTELDDQGKVATRFLRDASRSIIARNESPDIPFDSSVNPYRGCEHGCAYCYARPTHEYLGFSAGLDFESRILIKQDAAALLRAELSKPSWRPQVVAMSGVTDPYQPIEKKMEITRACLKVLADFRNPVGIVTKNALVTRDIDLLSRLSRHDAVAVYLSITTLDAGLSSVMEPRCSQPLRRLEALRRLAEAGIPCGVMVAPVIPGLTDHEIPRILEAAADAGARTAGTIMLRLPGEVADLFESWLRTLSPERHRKVMTHVQSVRSGRRNDPTFGQRMRGAGPVAANIRRIFETSCRRHGLNSRPLRLATTAFRRSGQNDLPFDEFTDAANSRF
jgi:DNA repair photolyase